MKKKYMLPLVLVVICMVLLLAGCTPAGNGYMALTREIASLPQYSFSGDMSVSMTLPESLTEEFTEEDMLIMDKLSDMSFTLDGDYIAASQYFDYTIGYDLSGEEGSLHFIMDKADLYINVLDMATLVEVFSTEEDRDDIEVLKEVLDGSEWLKINNMETMEDMEDDLDGFDTSAYLAFNESLYDHMPEYQEMVYDYVDYLNDHSFAAYKPDIFFRSGNKYTMRITEEDFCQVCNEFIVYIFTNYPDIIQDTKEFISEYDVDWLTEALGMDKQEILDGLEEMAEWADEDDLGFDELSLIQASINAGLLMLDGSSMETSIEKRSSNKYRQEFDMNFIFTAMGESMTMQCSGTMDIDASADIEIEIPTSGVITLDELEDSVEPVSMTATIDTGYEYATWEKAYEVSYLNESGFSFVTLINKDGQNYLPLREVGELLGENVSWDQDTKTAYVTVEGQKIAITGFIEEGRTYVKLREFEKLGYTVDWDGIFGVITMTKNY